MPSPSWKQVWHPVYGSDGTMVMQWEWRDVTIYPAQPGEYITDPPEGVTHPD